jgi:HEAT repeat protein
LVVAPDVARGQQPEPVRSGFSASSDPALRRFDARSEGMARLDIRGRAHPLLEDLAFYPESEDVIERPGADVRARESWTTARVQIGRTLLLADPGYGKTTLLWHEVVRRNDRALASIRTQAGPTFDLRFALFLRAADLARIVASEPDSLSTAVAGWFSGRNEDCRRLLEQKIECGDCLLAVDAFDEVPSGGSESLRSALTSALSAFGRRFPQASLLLSSRPTGFAGSMLSINEEDHLELVPFDDDQMEQAIASWLSDKTATGEAAPRQFRLPPGIRPLLRCPLLLSLACRALRRARRASDTPDAQPARWERRVDLYEAFLADALARWSERALPPPTRDQRSSFRLFAADLAEALWRRDPERTLWHPSEVWRAIEVTRPRYPSLEPAARPQLLEDLCVAGILTPAGPDRPDTPLAFTHRSFGHYLAACALADRIESAPDGAGASPGTDDVWGFLDRKAWDPAWEPIICCLAGRLADPGPLLDLLSSSSATSTNPNGDDCFGHRLSLAACCLAELRPDYLQTERLRADRVTADTLSSWWVLRSHFPAVVGTAGPTRALGALGQVNGRIDGIPLTDWICRRLGAPDVATREAAAAAVIEMGRDVPVSRLLIGLGGLLEDPDPAVRKVALEAVKGLGPAAGAAAAVPARLIELLRERDAWIDAVLALRCIGRAAAMPSTLARLAHLLVHSDWRVRQAAARAVGALGSAAATGPILACFPRLLQDSHVTVRQAAVEAVIGLGAASEGEAIVSALISLLRDPDEAVGHGAAEAIGRMGGVTRTGEFLAQLVQLMEDADPAVRRAAAWAVRSMGTAGAKLESRARVAELLGDAPDESQAASAPAREPDEEETSERVARLLERLGHPVPDIRQSAADAVARMGAAAALPEVVGRLAPLVRDASIEVRIAAAKAVGALGGVAGVPEVLAALREQARDEDEEMRAAAASALTLLMAQGVRLFEGPGGAWYARTVTDLSR